MKRGILVGIMLSFFMLNIAGICLRYLFPLTNSSAYDAERAGKVERLLTFTVAVAQLLRYRRGMFPYSLKCSRQDPSNSHSQCATGLWLYGNQPLIDHLSIMTMSSRPQT